MYVPGTLIWSKDGVFNDSEIQNVLKTFNNMRFKKRAHTLARSLAGVDICKALGPGLQVG